VGELQIEQVGHACSVTIIEMGKAEMRKFICFATAGLLLASCVPPVESPTPTYTPTLAPTLTVTPVPIATESPTVTPTLQPTLSSDQYPKLADFVLRRDDVSPDTFAYSIFWSGSDQSVPPVTNDLSASLEEQGLCSLDCVKLKWANAELPSRYIEISLIREENAQKAIKASFDLCTSLLHDATLHWTTPWAPADFGDCQSEMDPKIGFTPYTWILGWSGADVYGSVLIVAHVIQNDHYVDFDIVHHLLGSQIEKLKSMDFPVRP